MAHDRTLVQIRERSFLDLLDLALAVIRKRPRALGLAALAGVAPFAALNAWLTSDPAFPLWGFLALLALEAPWATAPLTIVLGGIMFGEEPSPKRIFPPLWRELPALLFYQLFIRGLLLGSFFFAPVIPARLAFLNEVILLEQGKARSAGRRCATLCGARGGELCGEWLAQLAFGLLFVLCLWAGSGAILSSLTTSDLTWDSPGWGDFYALRSQVAIWLAISFFAVARFLTYIDMRIRIEGWEVKLRLLAVGRSLEEASRW
ncbi:MAG: hypothetical protein NVSMB9_19750 [Isosphaeraceae bacterium]